jgi:hypothetical protein
MDNVEKYGTVRQAIDTFRIRNIYCFPRQQWLRERPSILRYTYIAYLVYGYALYLKHYTTPQSYKQVTTKTNYLRIIKKY